MLSKATRAGPLNLQVFRTFLIALMVAEAVCFGTVAHAAVGRTPGTFAVSATGGATYTIPIWAPPGPQGVRPNIALTYNSRQDKGYVGVGWTIKWTEFYVPL